MLAHGYHELLREPWVAILEFLQQQPAASVPVIAEHLQMSYMGTKPHCEALVQKGYLERIRVPREQSGRPEVSYRLSAKASELLPHAPVQVSLQLLDAVKSLYGNAAPEKVLHQYYQQRRESWLPRLRKGKSIVEKATMLADLLNQQGHIIRCRYDVKGGFRLEQWHHPQQLILDAYPTAIAMEQKMIEILIGTPIERIERHGGRSGLAHIDFLIPTLS